MDRIDRLIVDLLRRDARAPLKAIAGAVGLARSSVADRIARLEASGIIVGYRAEIAFETGEKVAGILSLLLDRTPRPDVVRAIVADPAVVRCYSLGGEIDLLVEIFAPTSTALNDVRDRLAAFPGVSSVRTHFILKREKG